MSTMCPRCGRVQGKFHACTGLVWHGDPKRKPKGAHLFTGKAPTVRDVVALLRSKTTNGQGQTMGVFLTLADARALLEKLEQHIVEEAALTEWLKNGWEDDSEEPVSGRVFLEALVEEAKRGS